MLKKKMSNRRLYRSTSGEGQSLSSPQYLNFTDYEIEIHVSIGFPAPRKHVNQVLKLTTYKFVEILKD